MFKRLDWWLPTAVCIAFLSFGHASVAQAGAPIPVPEPAEIVAVLGMGGAVLIGLVWRRLRRRR
jgi:hypothetical protein